MLTVTKFGGIITNEFNQVITADGVVNENIVAVGPCVYKSAPSADASLFIAPSATSAVKRHFL